MLSRLHIARKIENEHITCIAFNCMKSPSERVGVLTANSFNTLSYEEGRCIFCDEKIIEDKKFIWHIWDLGGINAVWKYLNNDY